MWLKRKFQRVRDLKDSELAALAAGKFIVGLGLGALLAAYLQKYALYIIAAGIVLHLPACYKILKK